MIAHSPGKKIYMIFTSFRVIPRTEVFSCCASRTSVYAEDAGHVPLTTRFAYITYFWEMLAFQVNFCHFKIYNNKSQLLLHPCMPFHLINLKNQFRYRLLNM